MHFNWHFDQDEEEISKLVTTTLLKLCDKYKDDERIFPKEDKDDENK